MSRSYNEHHKLMRGEKFPSPYIDNSGKKSRHRKMKPYGSKGYCDNDGIYVKKWGEICLDIVDKRKPRRDSKKQILQDLYEE